MTEVSGQLPQTQADAALKQVVQGCGTLIGVLLLIPVSAWCYGFTIMRLWLWFVVPLGAKALSLAWAFGLSVLLELVTIRYTYVKDDYLLPLRKRVVWMLARPWLALVTGWVAHRYFM
jgi:hypothetical protein